MRPVAIACLVLLSGCTAPEPAEDADHEQPCIVEAADDYSCQELDQSKRPDEVAHRHDYWGGRETVRLLEEERSFGQSIITSCDPHPMVSFLPPEEATIYQGTGRVGIAMALAEDPDSVAGPSELWIKRADQPEPEFVADFEDGAEITLEIPYNASDLPHQTLSAWEFWVYVHPDPATQPAYCAVQPRGTLGLTVDIHKTLEIKTFPGHPDHWANRTELSLLDDFAQYVLIQESINMCLGGDGSDPDGSCQMHSTGFGPRDGRVVPPGTDMVRVTLEAEPDPAQSDARLGLEYHGADTRAFTRADPVERDGNVAFYEIDVDQDADGPYAEQSQWRFRVVADSHAGTYRGGWTLDGAVVRAD